TTVHADRRFVDNGRVVCSAGIAAGIDMSLHVVGRLLGQEIAEKTARQMEYPYTTASRSLGGWSASRGDRRGPCRGASGGGRGVAFPMPEGRDMNLAIFDIDGTLTESVAVDERCFVQAFREVLAIGRINTNWLDYPFQTDSGLALEICRRHLGREPGGAE